MPGERTVLLADADVLIDYRESELGVLELVVEHVGRVVVLEPVLVEVRGVTASQCTRLGIEVVEVETQTMIQAAEVESTVSFTDRLCLVSPLSRRAVPISVVWASNADATAATKSCGTSVRGNVGAERVGQIQSLIATCVLQDVDPYTYLVDVLQRIDTQPAIPGDPDRSN